MNLPNREEQMIVNMSHNDVLRPLVDRVLITASLVLLVLTVLLTAFLNAEHYWHGHAKAAEVRAMELRAVEGMSTAAKERLIAKLDDDVKLYRRIKGENARNARVVAGMMSIVLLGSAFGFPAGVTREAPRRLLFFAGVLFVLLLLIAVAGVAYCVGLWKA